MTDAIWKYKPLRSRTLTTAGGLAAGMVWVATVATIFASGVATPILVASGVLTGLTTLRIKYTKSAEQEVKSKGKGLSKDAEASKMVAEIARQLGMDTAPNIYVLSDSFYQKFYRSQMAWYLKLADKLGLAQNYIEQKQQASKKKTLGAISGKGACLLATNESLKYLGSDSRALRMALAHEMSHIKANDSLGVSGFVRMAGSLVKPMIALMCAVAVLSSFVGGSTILAAGMPLWGAVGLAIGGNILADAGLKFASRVKERRADRNAVYLTGEVEGAEACMELLHTEKPKPMQSLREIFHSHPSYKRRMSALKKSWERVQAHSDKKSRQISAQPVTP